MRRFTYLKNVTTLKLHEERCSGCGTCLLVCPHAVFSMEGKKARVVNADWCMECGACAENCPAGAVNVDAGVGCASAIIGGALGFKKSACC